MTPRRILLALMTMSVAVAAGCGVRSYMPVTSTPVAVTPASVSVMSSEIDDELDALERKQQNNPNQKLTFTLMSGTVTQLLPDDTHGLPHQHFMYRGEDGRIYKVAHNTKLAPKAPVKVGDKVNFKGELVKASPNDVMHWTHWNPKGGEGGYIEHGGKKYEKIPGSH